MPMLRTRTRLLHAAPPTTAACACRVRMHPRPAARMHTHTHAYMHALTRGDDRPRGDSRHARGDPRGEPRHYREDSRGRHGQGPSGRHGSGSLPPPPPLPRAPPGRPHSGGGPPGGGGYAHTPPFKVRRARAGHGLPCGCAALWACAVWALHGVALGLHGLWHGVQHVQCRCSWQWSGGAACPGSRIPAVAAPWRWDCVHAGAWACSRHAHMQPQAATHTPTPLHPHHCMHTAPTPTLHPTRRARPCAPTQGERGGDGERHHTPGSAPREGPGALPPPPAARWARACAALGFGWAGRGVVGRA